MTCCAPGVEAGFQPRAEGTPSDEEILFASHTVGDGLVQTVPAKPGTTVLSGMLNLNGSLEVRITRPAADSFIAGMIRLMEAAEQGRARYRRLADRAAALYSPVVHTLAAVAFLGWMMATGDWHHSLTVAISVLIITCPCALGLAVPMVQVVAARRLFERGIALKDGSALERLAEADTAVFDKTGTLTLGDLKVARCTVTGEDLDAAIALAGRSRHPASRAIAALGGNGALPEIAEFQEVPGRGVQGRIGGNPYRLGRADWALSDHREADGSRLPGTVVSRNGTMAGFLELSDTVRPQASEAMASLRDGGFDLEVLSGDRREPVAGLAASLGIATFRAGLLPRDKVARLDELAGNGRKALMVGDGLNDAPALSAAHVSMAPASAADIGRASADLVFFGSGLMAVPEAVRIARTARRIVFQNLALAVGYNLLVIPLALCGQVTPLMAAVAMSLSSILVVGNALNGLTAESASEAAGWIVSDDRASRVTVLFWLIPIALAMGVVGLVAFLWSMRSGQYEDLDGAAERVLLSQEEDRPITDDS